MSRIQEEKNYWDKNALDDEVDIKYISDADDKWCLYDIGELTGNVLEIGCGVGRLMKDGYTGIDISQNMLDIAKKRKPKCHFKLTDGRTIPFKDKSFDTVYCYLVFQHLPKDAVKGYIDEAYRVLKKDGIFVFQWIIGDEDEPFSKHLGVKDIGEFTKRFSDVGYSISLAYNNWTITRCIK